MPQVIETVVYPLSELTDSARETARNWYRQHCFDHPWYDFVFEDFQTICELLGIRIAISPVHRIGGPSREDPQIYFRGFSWQGDGACFVGRYCYARNSAAAIHAHAPQDRELHRIADTLHDVQRRNFWQLRADIRHRGHYTHERTEGANYLTQGRFSLPHSATGGRKVQPSVPPVAAQTGRYRCPGPTSQTPA